MMRHRAVTAVPPSDRPDKRVAEKTGGNGVVSFAWAGSELARPDTTRRALSGCAGCARGMI